jgi:signal transduction histidine kinase
VGYIPYLLYKQKNKAEKLRVKLASDLHDELGSILNTVSIYTDLALQKGEERYLLKIKESTQEAITGIRNIIWQLDDNDTSFTNLVSRINNFASFLCQVKKIHFKVDVSKESFLYRLGEAEKANLYMIVKEAINNSIKYADAKEIRFSIDLENGKPVIEISDDGKGYNENECTMGNGIRNMKTRALNIRYKFSMKSSAGTVLELRKK